MEKKRENMYTDGKLFTLKEQNNNASILDGKILKIDIAGSIVSFIDVTTGQNIMSSNVFQSINVRPYGIDLEVMSCIYEFIDVSTMIPTTSAAQLKAEDKMAFDTKLIKDIRLFCITREEFDAATDLRNKTDIKTISDLLDLVRSSKFLDEWGFSNRLLVTNILRNAGFDIYPDKIGLNVRYEGFREFITPEGFEIDAHNSKWSIFRDKDYVKEFRFVFRYTITQDQFKHFCSLNNLLNDDNRYTKQVITYEVIVGDDDRFTSVWVIKTISQFSDNKLEDRCWE